MPLHDSIAALAKAAKLADPTDLQALVDVGERLERLADDAAAATMPALCTVALQATALLERVVLREVDDPAAALDLVMHALAFAQEFARRHAAGEETATLVSPFASRIAPPPPPNGATSATAPTPVDDPERVRFQAEGEAVTLAEFLLEMKEHLDNAERSALSLERTPGDMEEVNAVFRAFHTIKGVAAFMNLTPMIEVAHAAETMLERIRSGQLQVSASVIELIFASRDMLERLAAQLLGGDAPLRSEMRDLAGQLEDAAAGRAHEPERDEPTAGERPHGRGAPVLVGPMGPAGPPPGGAMPPRVSHIDHTVKVSIDRLDQLLDLMGELVIAELMVAQDPMVMGIPEQRVHRNLNHMARIVRELHGSAVSLRMVTLHSTFQKMSRVVHDLMARVGKHIALETLGSETEIDRNIVDQLADPLMHMIRNACDHGIESPEERIAAGKPADGHVTIRAYQRGGMIWIEVEDDGRGLQRERIIAKCRERGLLAPGTVASELSDAEVWSFIFLPGFSTAERITDISGRGVGMDVVKKSIEDMRGKIEIRSRPGQGSTFVIRLPLTTAIIEGMIVRVGSQRYILPTGVIESPFRPNAGDVRTVLGGGEIATVRNESLPLRRLNRILGLAEGVEDPRQGLLLVVEIGGVRSCLLVDEILGQQQVVIKNLGQERWRSRAVSGGAILGDGHIALILDLGGFAPKPCDAPRNAQGTAA